MGEAFWFGGLIALAAIAAITWIPWQPVMSPFELDASWVVALHEHFANKTDWINVAFTFGPWGMLFAGYDSRTFVIATLAWFFIAIAIGLGMWTAATGISRQRLPRFAWLFAMTLLVGGYWPAATDLRLWTLPTLLLFIHFFIDRRPLSTTKVLLVIAVALTSLCKSTSLPSSGFIVLLLFVDCVFKQRRFPWLVVIFAGALVLFWRLAGQHLNEFGIYLRNSQDIVGGFSDAMSLYSTHESRELIIVLTILGLFAGMMLLRRPVREFWLPALGIAAVTLVAFKAGFVRNDDGHQNILAGMLACLVLLGGAVSWQKCRHIVEKCLWGVLLGGAVFQLVESKYPVDWWPGELHAFSGTARLVSGHNDAATQRAKAEAEIRQSDGLSALDGTADCYPFGPFRILAHGWAYQPRPVMASYSVYTPRLAELNAQSLRKPDSPLWILFDIRPLNDRYPACEDGLCWPELISRYEMFWSADTFILLRRLAIPNDYSLKPIESLTIHLGEKTRVPSDSSSLIWAKLKIKPTLSGQLRSALYKPPTLILTVWDHRGTSAPFRIVPGQTEAGFLLSPYVANRLQFDALRAEEGRASLRENQVDAIEVDAAPGTMAPELFFQRDIACSFDRLEFSKASKPSN